LLEEISWEGNARHYRQGGRGLENVLTAEVFQAIDFLPRTIFFQRVLESLTGASEAVHGLVQEVEQATFSVLPGDIFLAKSPELRVQPDVVIKSRTIYCMVEAKRVKRSTFQPEQLAREYLAVSQEAGHRRPLLVLVVPAPPPIPVRGRGKMQIADAIASCLEPLLLRCDHDFPVADELLCELSSVIAYTTWPALVHAVTTARDEFSCGNVSVDLSVRRLADAAIDAISWHS
jgi:hypothetical protein